MNEKEIKSTSKFLSLVLRHKPEVISITLDPQGWVKVTDLLIALNNHRRPLSLEILNYIVETNEKKRFAFSEDKQMIRASQGHSIEVDLAYKVQVPPHILYHGTASKSVESILDKGLVKGDRQHVHLSTDIQTAITVGKRHGKPVVFEVLAQAMFHQGYKFYLSENSIWLTDFVPPVYLIKTEN